MITVVIASYGYAHLAANAIDSVLAQTLKPDRIILVDDGKHDGLEKIGRIYGVDTLVRGRNFGTAPNFDDILRNHVHTEKVMFLGADNWLRMDALEKMNAAKADIVSTDIAICGEHATAWKHRTMAHFERGFYIWKFVKLDINRNNYIHGSSLYNANLAKRYGYRVADGLPEDHLLWRDMIKGGATHCHLAEPLLFYRRHRTNFSPCDN